MFVALGEVAIAAQAADVVEPRALAALEDARAAAEHLAGGLEEQNGFGISFDSDNPLSEIPSSPPTRFSVTSGRSAVGIACVCSVFTLPNCARILPTFSSRLPGSDVNVMKPSSTSRPSGPAARKKSARAYGSTTAWNAASASVSCKRRLVAERVLARRRRRSSRSPTCPGLNTFDVSAGAGCVAAGAGAVATCGAAAGAGGVPSSAASRASSASSCCRSLVTSARSAAASPTAAGRPRVHRRSPARKSKQAIVRSVKRMRILHAGARRRHLTVVRVGADQCAYGFRQCQAGGARSERDGKRRDVDAGVRAWSSTRPAMR